VLIPAGRHPGLLTRAANLVTASGSKNPVLRGARILEDFLCMRPPPPPATLPADAFVPPPFDLTRTVRERYAIKTSVQPCVGCHATINPPGFALSHYNGLGRYEETEPAFHQDGSYSGMQLPVDSSVDLTSILGAGAQAGSPAEFTAMLAERAETRKCFTQEYAKYFLQREVTTNDGCRLNALYGHLREGKPLSEFMLSLARDPAFRLRRL
jgi:hypothetical protein